jgi:hypothetical protein
MENFVKQERVEANPNWPQLAQKAEEVIDDCEQVINAKKRQQMVTISQMNPLITEGEKLKIDERFMNDLRDLIAINVEDPGSIRYPEWKKEADKRLQMIRNEIQRKKDANVVPFDEIQKVAKINGVTPLAVKKFKDQPTDRQIIERVCGGDMTKGSCSSLAFTYAGNKCGFDVLDFRDGMSRKIFATGSNINRIAKDVGGIVNEEMGCCGGVQGDKGSVSSSMYRSGGMFRTGDGRVIQIEVRNDRIHSRVAVPEDLYGPYHIDMTHGDGVGPVIAQCCDRITCSFGRIRITDDASEQPDIIRIDLYIRYVELVFDPVPVSDPRFVTVCDGQIAFYGDHGRSDYVISVQTERDRPIRRPGETVYRHIHGQVIVARLRWQTIGIIPSSPTLMVIMISWVGKNVIG